MIKSLNHFEAIIGYSRKEIREALENIDNYYYHFEKPKKSGRVRHFYPSYRVLKDIHNRLVSRVFSNVTFPYFITGSVKKRSNSLNAKLHSGKDFHLKTDLSAYFDFVTCKHVYDSLIGIGFSPDIASIITKLTTYKGHLPQGAPTSPFLSNLVGLPMDFGLLKICNNKRITYTRYIDDLSFSCHIDFKDEVDKILSVVSQFGFLYNHKKTIYKVGEIEITGIAVNCNGIKAPDLLIQSLEKVSDQSTKDGMRGYIDYIKKLNKKKILKTYKKKYEQIDFPAIININKK